MKIEASLYAQTTGAPLAQYGEECIYCGVLLSQREVDVTFCCGAPDCTRRHPKCRECWLDMDKEWPES